MNKEVIYLEPEDDITDILTKLQQAEQKLVILVPPKKAAILRSAVNIKLVAKASKEAKKATVIVTQDPGIMKLAMGSKIMIAKTLQSRPAVPTEADFAEYTKMSSEQVINDDGLGTATVGDALKDLDKKEKGPTDHDLKDAKTLTDDELDDKKQNDAKDLPAKKPRKADKGSSKFARYRKQIIAGSIASVLLIALLVWALVFAPAVTIAVSIRATATNFAENVSFTENVADENIEEGKFFAEKHLYEQKISKDFKATGTENRGNKASGKVDVSFTFVPFTYFGEGGYTASVPAGTVFSNGSKEYVATTSASNSWDGETTSVTCDNAKLSGASSLKKDCTFVLTVNVEATAPGEDYNLESSNTWSDFNGASVANSAPISGGTTDQVTVVSQNDVNLARISIEESAADESDGKERLYGELDKDVIIIESSYKREQGEPVSTPAVGSEVGEGAEPKVEIVVAYSVYTVDKAKVEEYIKLKTQLADDQKIYTYGEPYFERFTDINSVARLKTTIKTGPTVTEEGILEKARGRKIGEIQSALRSITGVSNVEITPSFFWVSSVPDDPNKITIELKTEEGES